MNQFPFLTSYRLLILILAMIVGFFSLFFRLDLIYIPATGLLLYFLPTLASLREIKKPYYVKAITLFAISFLINAFAFIYTHVDKTLQNKPNETSLVELLLLALGLNIFFLLVALASGIIWKNILKLNSAHFRVLLNLGSLPVVAFIILFCSIYYLSSSQAQESDRWYYALVIPGLLMTFWGVRVYGIYKTAQGMNMQLTKFIYENERNRFEAPNEFRNDQINSRKLTAYLIVFGISIFTLNGVLESNIESVVFGLLLVCSFIFSLYKSRKK